jgi:hypothetical protein
MENLSKPPWITGWTRFLTKEGFFISVCIYYKILKDEKNYKSHGIRTC